MNPGPKSCRKIIRLFIKKFKYLFKVGPVELTEETELLSGIVDLFEDGVALGKAYSK